MVIPGNTISRLSVMNIADLLQLLPVRAKLTFARFYDKDSKTHLLGLQSCHLYIKFSEEKSGSNAMKSPYLGRHNSWVPIEKCETEISIKKGSASPEQGFCRYP